MKYFIPLTPSDPLGIPPKQNQSPIESTVYGPYKDQEAVEEALKELFPQNRERRQYLVFDAKTVTVEAKPITESEERDRAFRQSRLDYHLI